MMGSVSDLTYSCKVLRGNKKKKKKGVLLRPQGLHGSCRGEQALPAPPSYVGPSSEATGLTQAVLRRVRFAVYCNAWLRLVPCALCA